MSWSAAQYSKFEAERTRPVRDLVAAIPNAEVKTAADLGCGPGNSTEVLAARYPQAAISGMDSDPDMIAAAQKRLPKAAFELAAIESWAPARPVDVILANASLQWVPEHETLLPRLIGALAPGGSLCVQMPDNLDEPVHVVMRAIAADGPWAPALANASKARGSRKSADWYYRLLREHALVDIWRTTYHHPLAGGAAAVVEWFRGAGLRPFLQPLDETMKADFLARYETDIAKAYPALADGTVLLPFPRLFFVARRS
jgi:trans-aconitate 2-methyltransferase